METKYTSEQVKDIEAREKEALETLKKLELTPACQIIKVNLDDDVFADRLYPYLADTKYSKKEVRTEPAKKEVPIKSPFGKK